MSRKKWIGPAFAVAMALSLSGCPKEQACSDDDQCAAGQICHDEACSPCSEDAQCGVGMVCSDGECSACTEDAQCGDGEVCRLGRCGQHLLAALSEAGGFDTFLQFVEAAELYDELAYRQGEYTLFVPDDASFRGLPRECSLQLLGDAAALELLVRMHVGLGLDYMDRAELQRNAAVGEEIPVETSEVLTSSLDGEEIRLDGLLVDQPAIATTAAIAHPIRGGVFLPPAGIPAECMSAP